jgi:hypothetical protein
LLACSIAAWSSSEDEVRQDGSLLPVVGEPLQGGMRIQVWPIL